MSCCTQMPPPWVGVLYATGKQSRAPRKDLDCYGINCLELLAVLLVLRRFLNRCNVTMCLSWRGTTEMPDCSSAFLPAREAGVQAVPFNSQSTAPCTLLGAPFELLVSVKLKFLSLKTTLLTALASVKRVGDLQAFSVNKACLEFRPADSHVIQRPRPSYVPKVPTTPFRDQVVNLQVLPPKEADPALALLCPVRTLRNYVDRNRSFRCSEQLFFFSEDSRRGMLSPSRDALSLAYEDQGEPCPLGVRAHSTRSVASSYALVHGTSPADICRAAGWATPNTFARFYNLRVKPVSSRVLRMFPPVNPGPPCPAVLS
ncbi:putative aspartoacylase [Labeo rohita]|uniref:Aspartoacylase n=1 Tax=Labeo rohita TaxID=84645 RepID=A0ABQ8LJH2_LABRO|nr:putative aspartoacylase [Labeo rohita]